MSLMFLTSLEWKPSVSDIALVMLTSPKLDSLAMLLISKLLVLSQDHVLEQQLDHQKQHIVNSMVITKLGCKV